MLSRNNIIKGLTTIIFAIQLILYYAIYYVQKLTKQSAGVNHHLRFRKTQLMNDYFPDYILIILSVLIVMAVIVFLWWYIKGWQNTWLTLSLGWLITCSVLNLLFIYLPYFTDSLAYPYWIIVGIMNVVISWIIFVLSKQIKYPS